MRSQEDQGYCITCTCNILQLISQWFHNGFTMVSQWPHLPLYSNVDFRPKNLKHIMQALEAWTMGMSHGCSLQSIKLSNIIKTLTIWLFNIAMENGPFIDGLPIKNGDFPWLC